MKCFTRKEIATELKLSKSALKTRIDNRGIKPHKIKDGKYFYNRKQIQDIMQAKIPEKTIIIEKYYPLKTTETFYIYESKMNRL